MGFKTHFANIYSIIKYGVILWGNSVEVGNLACYSSKTFIKTTKLHIKRVKKLH